MSSRPRDSLYYSSGTNTNRRCHRCRRKGPITSRRSGKAGHPPWSADFNLCRCIDGSVFPVGYTRNARRAGFRPILCNSGLCHWSWALCTPSEYMFMKHPITGEAPVSFTRFSSATAREHLLGLLGGAVWCSGRGVEFRCSRSS